MSSVKIQKVSSQEDRSLPVFAEFDQLVERIRKRAFDLFNGRTDGSENPMEDWLKAEREICWPAAAELSESDGEFDLDIALAGFDASDIAVTATPAELIVKARHETKDKQKERRRDAKVRWSEFKSEDVYRRVNLPQPVDVDKVTAHFENGLLKITAPKSREQRQAPKRVQISAA